MTKQIKDYPTVSINKEYMLITRNGVGEKIELSTGQLIRLNREIANVLWERKE
tara:strand:- start:254 stop:412 length:159 start_codon:yes stop_codon:yes gene_type:complete